MADRRMFSKRIINSARFLKMPVSTQCLYFHLGLHADDDGIVEAYTIINSVGASEDDLKVLVAKGFVTVLNDDLVTYITDWAENNKIRSDRKVDSIYRDLLLQVLPDVNIQQKTMRADVRKKLDVQWTSNGQPMDGVGKDRIGKDRLGEVREGKDRLGEEKAIVSVDTICSNDLERISEAWNSLSDVGITQIRGIVGGTKRYSQVRKRVNDYGIDAVLVAIHKIRDSKFLQGKATDFTITFDWFIRPNNFIKVYEGNYDDKINRTGNRGADMLEKSYEMMKEWSETDG
jgi:hypothetical protein